MLFKTVCIKTSNKNIADYLLKELEYFEFKDIYVSCYDFRFYTNVIIHYVGKNVDLFRLILAKKWTYRIKKRFGD